MDLPEKAKRAPSAPVWKQTGNGQFFPWTTPPRVSVSRVNIRVRVRFMVWVRAKCPGGEMSEEMSDWPWLSPSETSLQLYQLLQLLLHSYYPGLGVGRLANGSATLPYGLMPVLQLR